MQELVVLIKLLLVFFWQERAGKLSIPLRDEDVQVLRYHVLHLKLTEVEEVRHEVTVREDHTFVSQFIKVWVNECVARADPPVRLIDQHFR